ncbi:hypothetical protein MRB53_030802 [Persea americana]|uniref:Uncharacterized protein n=1 Tax=Persea americana TaxID=3435 RepID=A0ACC2KMV7_PERAE|nr:hypothetical protein MRB53_030802 [Persea americana]
MARVSPPVLCSPSFSLQQALPTPSPFTNSLASSGGWRSSQPTGHLSNILLRFFAFLFSVVSSLSLFAPVPHNSILHYHEFRYCLSISILASVYSALQLLKGIHDIAFRGRYISDNICDYITFFMDQHVTVDGIPSDIIFISIGALHRTNLKDHSQENCHYIGYHVSRCFSCHSGLRSHIRLQALQEDHLVIKLHN